MTVEARRGPARAAESIQVVNRCRTSSTQPYLGGSIGVHKSARAVAEEHVKHVKHGTDDRQLASSLFDLPDSESRK